MGNWYRVTKRINGRFYDYWQRTYRVGKSVKTENKYIGPAGKAAGRRFAAAGRAGSPSVSGVPPFRPAASAQTMSPPVASSTTPDTPENAIIKLNPYAGLSPAIEASLRKWAEAIRREDEEIQYGELKDRIKRHKAMYRAVKKKTKGIKATNPFIARALLKKR